MRTLAILMAALVMALGPQVALAKSDKSPPGQAARAEDSDSPGQSGQTDSSGSGKSQNKPEPPGQAKKPDGPPGQAVEFTDAQRAVETNQALPLARIVAVAATRSDGRVVNAKLIQIDNVLLYELTMLDETGRSWRDYYYARTGNPVIIP
jgi:uncharacterized membrane protein YkoI